MTRWQPPAASDRWNCIFALIIFVIIAFACAYYG